VDLAEIHTHKRVILINPNWDEVKGAVRQVEKRCRKNKIDMQEVFELYEESSEDEFTQGWRGRFACPERFSYGVEGTVSLMIRIPGGLTGLCVERQHVEPGARSVTPIRESDPQSPSVDWFNDLLAVFWTHLKDEEVTALNHWMIQKVMQRAAEEEAYREQWRRDGPLRREHAIEAQKAAAKNRQKQLEILFRGIRPQYSSLLAESMKRISRELESETKQDVTWSTFKKRWPSVAVRYQNDLLPFLDNNRLSINSMRSLPPDQEFQLHLSLWTGGQRLRRVPQIVFVISSERICEELIQKDAGNGPLAAFLRRYEGSVAHPNAFRAVGWLRVHVDDFNKLVFVDEVQSDFMETLHRRKEKDALFKEAMARYTPWNLHGFASISRWADEIGYRVCIHSRESAVKKTGMTKSTRKWNTYYNPIIKRFGLTRAEFDGYPAQIYVRPITPS